MIKLGIIGTNFISDWMAEAISLTSGIMTAAVYSRSEESGRAFAHKHSIERVIIDFTLLLESDLDAVYVASPNLLHASQSIELLNHGFHVLCEKPIASNMKEYRLMTAAAENSGVVLLEAMRQSHDPSWQTIADAMPQIGKVRRASFEFCQYSSRYEQFMRGDAVNTFNPEMSNAAIMDLGVYPIHCIAKLFGKPNYVKSASVFLDNGFECSGNVLMGYDGMIAEAVYSKVFNSVNPSIITGEEGSIIINKLSVPAWAKIMLRDGTEYDLPITETKNNMIYEAIEFVRLIENGEVLHHHAQYSEITTSVIDEARWQTGTLFPSDL